MTCFGTTSLYRFFNASGQLLYVGISHRPLERFKQHSKDKSWWTEISSARLEHFETRQEAEEAERRAIKSEGPMHNLVWNQRPGLPFGLAKDQPGECNCQKCVSRRSGPRRELPVGPLTRASWVEASKLTVLDRVRLLAAHFESVGVKPDSPIPDARSVAESVICLKVSNSTVRAALDLMRHQDKSAA